jgi:hypothetical protein
MTLRSLRFAALSSTNVLARDCLILYVRSCGWAAGEITQRLAWCCTVGRTLGPLGTEVLNRAALWRSDEWTVHNKNGLKKDVRKGLTQSSDNH